MAKHKQAMECLDCESFLQLGIDAFNWLNRADEQIRYSILKGKMEHDPQVDEAIQVLFEAWMVPCKIAHEMVKLQRERNFKLDNLDEFLRVEANVKAILKDNRKLTAPIAALRDQAIEQHSKGQTSEWALP